MYIVATITNDTITPLVMASIDVRFYANDNFLRDSKEYATLVDRNTVLTLHEMATEKIARYEHNFNTIKTVDNRHIT